MNLTFLQLFSWTSGWVWQMWPLLWMSEFPSTTCSQSKSTWRVMTSSTPSWLKTCRWETCTQPESCSLNSLRSASGFSDVWAHLKTKLSDNDGMSLQVMLDQEQQELEFAARFAQPRSTDSFDYSNYHTLSEVSTWLVKYYHHRQLKSNSFSSDVTANTRSLSLV